MVNYYEAGRTTPWEFEPSLEFYQKLAGGVVGFKIEVTRLEGKRKLSQNHPLERQQKVVEALQQSPDPTEQVVAQLMAENLAAAK
jgi:transcriptional regulator